MKNIILALACVITCLGFKMSLAASAQAQSTKISTPMGNVVSIAPGTTITQTSPSTVFYSETIPANTLIPVRWFPLHMEFQLTTPTIGVPGISITVQFGSQTYNIMSSAALVGGSNSGLFTLDLSMVALTNSFQKISARVSQPNGTLITLGSGYSPVGNFTVDNSVDNLFTVSIQFTGVSLGTSQLVNFWTLRNYF
jgi:hypothetical protein